MTIKVLLPELIAYARSISDRIEDADDLVNDAIERGARSDKRPAGTEALRPWMFRVIRNLSFDELRKRRVRREYSEAVRRLYNDGSSGTFGTEEAILVRTAFERLNTREREILFLVDILGMKYAEAADVLNVPAGTVMSRLSRARRALADLFSPMAETPLKSDKTRE